MLASACGSEADSSDAGSAPAAPTTSTSATAATTSTAGTAGSETPSSTAGRDGAGETRVLPSFYGDVEVPVAPQRVVAVSYDTPWQLQAVGVRPVAVQDYGKWVTEFSADQQEFVEGVATVGAYGDLNLEAVAAARPDLIVGDGYEIDEPTYELLSAIAPTFIAGSDIRGDWKSISSQIADAAGAGDAVGKLRDEYDSTLARLRAQYADELARNWAHFSLGDNPSDFSVQYPTGTTGALLFTELGATLAPSVPEGSPESGYESISTEKIADVLGGADVLVHFLNADGSPNPAIQAVIDMPVFATLPAAVAGHVYGMTTSVTDYATAIRYLEELEATALEPLAAG